MKNAFIFFMMLLGTITLGGQIEGLWEVEKVTVGEETMTPVAKWFSLESDQQLYSGNGGLRNMVGSWEYDEGQGTLLSYNEKNQADEYGPFQVSKESQSMTWRRVEEGVEVKVNLRKVEELPLAPWDKIVGVWQLESLTENGNLLEGKPFESVFMRWDRIFIQRGGADGRQTGIWHIHAHRSSLKLVSDAGDKMDSHWELEFMGENKMIWNNQEEGKMLHFKKS